MRMMLQWSVPVEAGNAAAKNGTLGPAIQKLIAELKPEAAYFFANEHGERNGMVVFDMKDTSEIPVIAEPLFSGFNAHVKFTPVMNGEDLAKGLAAVKR